MPFWTVFSYNAICEQLRIPLIDCVIELSRSKSSVLMSSALTCASSFQGLRITTSLLLTYSYSNYLFCMLAINMSNDAKELDRTPVSSSGNDSQYQPSR